MRRLTSDLHKDRNALWDPQGERLMFYSTRSGRWEGWIVGADGSDLRQVTDVGSAFLTSWSPDGDRILAVQGQSPNSTYYWVDPERLETLETATVIPELAKEQGFDPVAWSHAGDRVAGGVDTDFGRCEAIAIWSPATGSFRRLDVPVAGRAYGAVAGWTSDDRYVIVRSADGVAAVEADSGNWQIVAPAGSRSILSLSRDGRTLSVEEEILDSDVWLLEFE